MTTAPASLDEALKIIEKLSFENQSLRIQLERALKGWLGGKSEKLKKDVLENLQLSLFDSPEALLAELNKKTENSNEVEEITYTRKKTNKSSLKEFPSHVKVDIINHELDDTKCQKCSVKGQDGELTQSCFDVVRRLEYIPAEVKVEEHRRHKYQCSCCKTFVRAPKPMWLIDKGKAGEGLLAYIATSKFGDHLPYYRISQQFARNKIYIPETDMMNWTHSVAEQIKPLYKLMCEEVLKSKVIHSDDTIVPTRDNKKSKLSKGRAWIYCGDENYPYTVYHYTRTRKAEGPEQFLKGFKGYLQADGYKGYDALYKSGDVIEVSCMAHARRYFHDLLNYDTENVKMALKFIQDLYKIEKEIKEYTKNEKEKYRQEKAKPIFNGFGEWLEIKKQTLLPKASLQKAITYTLNHWQQLQVYMTDGELDIDNNEAERGMRCIALGRKNWLFVGNDRAGKTAAILYSFVTTCKNLNINIQDYLKYIFKRLPSTPKSELINLLPDQWLLSNS